jgi:hypothetical protein
MKGAGTKTTTVLNDKARHQSTQKANRYEGNKCKQEHGQKSKKARDSVL